MQCGEEIFIWSGNGLSGNVGPTTRLSVLFCEFVWLHPHRWQGHTRDRREGPFPFSRKSPAGLIYRNHTTAPHALIIAKSHQSYRILLFLFLFYPYFIFQYFLTYVPSLHSKLMDTSFKALPSVFLLLLLLIILYLTRVFKTLLWLISGVHIPSARCFFFFFPSAPLLI